MASKDELRKALALFDGDGEGFLTPAALEMILTRGQHALTEAQVKEFMEKHDTNRDGKLDLDELSKALGTDPAFRAAAAEARAQRVVHEMFEDMEVVTHGAIRYLECRRDNWYSLLKEDFKRILRREFSK